MVHEDSEELLHATGTYDDERSAARERSILRIHKGLRGIPDRSKSRLNWGEELK